LKKCPSGRLLLPETFSFGAKPSYDAKCLADLNLEARSKPASDIIVKMVLMPTPGIFCQ